MSERKVKVKQVDDPKRIKWAAGTTDAAAERHLEVPSEKSDPDVLAIRGASQRTAYSSGRGAGFRAAFGGRQPTESLYESIWPNQRAWLAGIRSGEWLAHFYPLPRRPSGE